MMDVSNLYIFERQVMGRQYLAGLEVSESFFILNIWRLAREILVYFIVCLLVCENCLQHVRGGKMF